MGGLVGNHYRGLIFQCYFRGEVHGEDRLIGGLVGWPRGDTEECYSTGVVTGNNPKALGGCPIRSFWDTLASGITSGINESKYGTGLGTVEMKTVETFTDSGWNFDSVWAISEDVNDGYPYLQWPEYDLTVSSHQAATSRIVKRPSMFTRVSSSQVKVVFTNPKYQRVTLTVFDARGRRVKTLHDGKLEAGKHSVIHQNQQLSSQLYYYKLSAGKNQDVRAVPVLR